MDEDRFDDEGPTEDWAEVSGTMLRGADGHLYVIPDEALRAFRVPERVGRPAIELLGELEDTVGAPTELNPRIHSLPAVQGPLGRIDLVAGPGTTIPALTALRSLRRR